jgi:hypothetical protein
MNSYISTEIMGGLGNQLFQIANLLLYNNYLNEKKIIIFKNEDNLFNYFNLPRKTFWNSLFLNQFKILENNDYNQIKFAIISEKENHKNLIEPFTYCPYNLLFKGYFQTFKYYDENLRNQMKSLIYSNENLVNKAKDNYNLIKEIFKSNDDNDFVSMHIRRTDYVYHNHYHHSLEIDYYNKALDMVKDKKIVVFSDDIEWCKENFSKDFYFIDINNVEIEFLLMSLFKNNIIANSTFSLWASFISPYNDKLVIAPKIWYGKEGPKDWNEIYHNFISILL